VQYRRRLQEQHLHCRFRLQYITAHLGAHGGPFRRTNCCSIVGPDLSTDSGSYHRSNCNSHSSTHLDTDGCTDDEPHAITD
jgi:hypothetical protein